MSSKNLYSNKSTDLGNTITLLNVQEVAVILNVSKSYVYKLIRNGQLRAVRYGRAVRVKFEDLLEFIRNCSQPCGEFSKN